MATAALGQGVLRPACRNAACPAGVRRPAAAGPRPCRASAAAPAASAAVVANAPAAPRKKKKAPALAPLVEADGGMAGLGEWLLGNRTLFVGSAVTDEVAMSVVTKLLALELADPEAEIKMYINSQGGNMHSVMAILDVMRFIKPDVVTVVFGCCASTPALLLSGGAKGKRYAMPSSRIMVHQPMGGAQGTGPEVQIQAAEINRSLKVCVELYMRFTGQSREVIEEMMDRDCYISAGRAVELGFIDGVVA